MGTAPGRAHDADMHTLHIDLTVTDLAGFQAGFKDNAGLRQSAGVVAERVSHLVGGAEGRLQIELDFGALDQAEAFLDELRTTIWPNSGAILAETPEARILEPISG
jgi:hypothetical protein